MLQPVFLNLVKGSTDHKMTSDDLYNMWSVASRAKSAIVQGRRLENLSWRLWYTSTIRSKIEMEEKRRRLEQKKGESDDIKIQNSNSEDEDEIFIETETENESNSSTSSSSNSKKLKTNKKKKKKQECTLVLPSDRPLFTSTCTSILAEIQDASFRFSSAAMTTGGAGFNMNQNHFYNITTTHSHGHSHNSYNNTSNNQHINHVHIISPPTNRSKSPGTSISSSANFTPKRKKNVEKFLKKFKTNLEDISEQIDEKLNFSDEETGEDQTKESKDATEQQQQQQDNNNILTDASIKSLSPTASSNHFATDEEGQFSSFYTRNDGELINIERPVTIKTKNQPSMISKLLKKESFGSGSSSSINSLRYNTVVQAPNFLFNQNCDTNYINDQLELMASNRYNNLIDGDRISTKSPNPQIFQQQQEMINEKRIIDANALSTSLSANKFKLEDEFDSQLVIW